MARVSEHDVRDIVEALDTTRVARFIRMASAMVDLAIACAAEQGEVYTADQLEQMELLLAAHFYTLKYPLAVSESNMKASASYKRGEDSYLKAALMFDPFGCLEELTSQQMQASGFWLGKPVSEQIDADDRD